MASIAVLKKKVKTLNDFTRVVNIQKIVVMKEIANWQKVIERSKIVSKVFIGLVKKINKSSNVLPNSLFLNEKRIEVPFDRKLHFIVQGNVEDALSEYELKLIASFCKKNNNPNDVYVIIGEGLGAYMKKDGFNILNIKKGADLTDPDIYTRIAFEILASFNDLLHNGATFGFLDTTMKVFNRETIFPLKIDEVHNFEGVEEFKNINDIKIPKITWESSYESVANKMILTAIESIIYQKVVEYSLSMKRRELQSLDDKEKNILEEITKVNLKIQRVRKDTVTNELLTNATAFSVLSEEEGNDG